jgi:hypothetical protein
VLIIDKQPTLADQIAIREITLIWVPLISMLIFLIMSSVEEGIILIFVEALVEMN